MKNNIILLLSIITILKFSASAQITNPWIKQGGYVAYMWPSFLSLENHTKTIDFSKYYFKVSDNTPGEIHFADCKVSQSEALTAALMLVGDEYEIKKYGIAKDKPNLIPYKGGVILYGYWKEKKRWELFNIQSNVLIEHVPYHRFDVVKK